MNRRFSLGDRIICKSTGVTGTAIKFYTPTSCAEQTMISTPDGRKYHAPTADWVKIEGESINTFEKPLNPYEEYLIRFAGNHGITIAKAKERPMVKARLRFFNETGM